MNRPATSNLRLVPSCPTEPRKVETPLEPFEGTRVTKRVVAIPVLRAGLGLLEAVTDLYPDAVVGYLGMERDEDTHQQRLDARHEGKNQPRRRSEDGARPHSRDADTMDTERFPRR